MRVPCLILAKENHNDLLDAVADPLAGWQLVAADAAQ